MPELVVVISLILIGLYAVLIAFLTYGVYTLKVFKAVPVNSFTSFSIVVAFRNEEENLPALLKSIHTLNYPKTKVELIIVNDFSSDASVRIVENFINTHPETNIQLLHNDTISLAPKKQALNKAIQQAKFERILTTDADCVLQPQHLNALNAFIQQTDCKMVVAPVVFDTNNTLLHRFQQFDLWSLMGATQGGFFVKQPFLCNGANLCFDKKTFYSLNGYHGNTHIASGDDLFLMEKFKKLGTETVQYLKSREVLVKTQPQHTLRALVQQRIRWAGKTTSMTNKSAKAIGALVFAANLLLGVLPFFYRVEFEVVIACWSIKILIDFVLLNQVAKFYTTPIKIPEYLLFSLLYPYYASIIAAASLTKGYTWKGRYFLR